jgi:CDP-paratose 2-epimerase
VYGDYPSTIGYKETETRYTPLNQDIAVLGFDESLPLDGTMHSLFGVSKLYADVVTQEYGLYYGMPTACFRCGCITGSHHRGVELHGFLAYLAKCVRDGVPYTIYGHKGKQVRDNIHAEDLARAILEFVEQPKVAAVYNMGGGPRNSISMQEAVAAFEYIFGRELDYTYDEQARKGDHIWWVSNTIAFEADYPDWERWWSLDMILEGFEETGR